LAPAWPGAQIRDSLLEGEVPLQGRQRLFKGLLEKKTPRRLGRNLLPRGRGLGWRTGDVGMIDKKNGFSWGPITGAAFKKGHFIHPPAGGGKKQNFTPKPAFEKIENKTQNFFFLALQFLGWFGGVLIRGPPQAGPKI